MSCNRRTSPDAGRPPANGNKASDNTEIQSCVDCEKDVAIGEGLTRSDKGELRTIHKTCYEAKLAKARAAKTEVETRHAVEAENEAEDENEPAGVECPKCPGTNWNTEKEFCNDCGYSTAAG